MPYRIGQRVKLNVRYSDELPKGTLGKIKSVLTRRRYDVAFYEGPRGRRIDPPELKTMLERRLDRA